MEKLQASGHKTNTKFMSPKFGSLINMKREDQRYEVAALSLYLEASAIFDSSSLLSPNVMPLCECANGKLQFCVYKRPLYR